MRCVIEEVDKEELTASRKLFLRKMLTLEAYGEALCPPGLRETLQGWLQPSSMSSPNSSQHLPSCDLRPEGGGSEEF